MNATPVRTLVRNCEARRRAGDLKKTTFHELIRAGLLPPAIRLSPRCSAHVAEEIDAVNAARIAGKSDEFIRSLVASLVEARQAITL